MSSYGLGLHTTSTELGLGISNFANQTRYKVWDLGRDLSNHFHHHLVEFVQPHCWKDFQFIAVAKGPGGFTSTRIGVVAARTLAQQLNVPLFAISTLSAIAWHHRSIVPHGFDLAVELPARREELFVAIYRFATKFESGHHDPETDSSSTLPMLPVLPEQVMSLTPWQVAQKKWDRPLHHLENPQHLGSSVLSLLELAHMNWCLGQQPHWSEAIPFYGQHPVE